MIAWQRNAHAGDSMSLSDLVVGGLALVLGLGLKLHYSSATSDELDWLLRPTAALTEAISGHNFVREPGLGDWCFERRLLIARGCGGTNYWVVTWWALVFGFVRRHQTGLGSVLWLFGRALISCFVMLAVNALRIAVSLWSAELLGAHCPLGFSEFHRVQGIAIYVFFLLILYRLIERTWLRADAPRVHGSVAWPLACYLAVSLLLPALHGAGGSPKFWWHALVTLGVGAALTGIIALLGSGPVLIGRYL